jgi:hypothetical protein
MDTPSQTLATVSEFQAVDISALFEPSSRSLHSVFESLESFKDMPTG